MGLVTNLDLLTKKSLEYQYRKNNFGQQNLVSEEKHFELGKRKIRVDQLCQLVQKARKTI